MLPDVLESTRREYDAKYRVQEHSQQKCLVSISDLNKTSRRVRQVCSSFGLDYPLHGKSALDIGCGLGFFSEALRQAGARVVGVDLSSEAIRRAAAAFPQVDFRCGPFPGVPSTAEKFDLIWVQDFAPADTFKVAEI